MRYSTTHLNIGNAYKKNVLAMYEGSQVLKFLVYMIVL